MKQKITPVIVIHGGAGVISKKVLTEDQLLKYHNELSAILLSAQRILEKGGSAVDAVTDAVVGLENCPLFNAGHGAVFTHGATHELDAAIMDGRDLNAGAVAGVSHIKNPILAAKKVMQRSDHLLFIGEGAEIFARKEGVEMVESTYFSTDFRRQQLKNAIENDSGFVLDHDGTLPNNLTDNEETPIDEKTKFGTVGAVAIDIHGNLAAATSTGGMTNKQIGRVGDTPIIGAGTYANNETVAISCTGTGEMFMRVVVAHDVSALMAYKGYSLEEATNEVVMNKLVKINGEGGLIAVDSLGNISLCFNSEGMYRGYAYTGQKPVTKIFKE
ncbi:isoaspartyl peptidase/L-asparaginase family protein [Thorsellia kenyensis]|uniref:Isoaspartyl peptidase/L-asparaginase family protein n=1 Tax=Thorsellia kenyensis TaxID=1549888 RepID=A0ABV6CB10_9GAMM